MRAHVEELVRVPPILLGVGSPPFNLLNMQSLDALLVADIGDGTDETPLNTLLRERSNPVRRSPHQCSVYKTFSPAAHSNSTQLFCGFQRNSIVVTSFLFCLGLN